MADVASRECVVCGFVYDEAAEDLPWDELPDDWECPVCGAGREEFEPVAGEAPDPAEAPAAPCASAAASRRGCSRSST